MTHARIFEAEDIPPRPWGSLHFLPTHPCPLEFCLQPIRMVLAQPCLASVCPLGSCALSPGSTVIALTLHVGSKGTEVLVLPASWALGWSSHWSGSDPTPGDASLPGGSLAGRAPLHTPWTSTHPPSLHTSPGGQQLDFSPLQPPGQGQGQARRRSGSKGCCALRSGSEAQRGATCPWRRSLWKVAELDSGCVTARSLPTERLPLHRSRVCSLNWPDGALTAAAAGKDDEAPDPPRHSTTRQWGFQSCGTLADLLQRLGALGAAWGGAVTLG